jgi:hypothetical protein
MQLNGLPVPVMTTRPGAVVGPPILSGHDLESADQIVLGASTLAQVHQHVGGYVTLQSPVTQPVRLRIVGTATLPSIGGAGGPHLEMATGAVIATSHLPPLYRNVFNNPVPGPNNILVRFKPGVTGTAAVASLNQIAQATSNAFNFGVSVEPVQKPAEIVNYRTLGATPAYLGAGLAVGAVAALALTLIASVRRRRRDLALLKTLGFTNRQLAEAIAWQSTVAVVIGTVAGVPIGIALGRWLWDLFARSIHAVPAPSVPVLTVVIVVIGALILGNLVAALPGRIAARTQTAVLLRSD